MSTCAACTARYGIRLDWQSGRCDHDSTCELIPLTRADLSVPDDSLDRAPRVGVVELSQLHMNGRSLYSLWTRSKGWAPSVALLDSIREAVSTPWGGVTFGPDGVVTPERGYAVTTRPRGALVESYTFDRMPWAYLLDRWVRAPYLGIFRDDESGMIDVDPVTLAPSLRDAQALGVYCRSTGGAFNFADGLGYWTPTL